MEKTNLREEILHNSRDLFEKNGYSAVSVRQIAKKSNCTAGSLYYFFEGGKLQILQEVIVSYGIDPIHSLEWVIETKSLDELIDRLILELPKIFKARIRKLNWLQFDLSRLGLNEIATLKTFPLGVIDAILRGANLHVNDLVLSKQIAWMIFTTISGYVGMAERIGADIENQFTLLELGETIKTMVKSLIHEKELKTS